MSRSDCSASAAAIRDGKDELVSPDSVEDGSRESTHRIEDTFNPSKYPGFLELERKIETNRHLLGPRNYAELSQFVILLSSFLQADYILEADKQIFLRKLPKFLHTLDLLDHSDTNTDVDITDLHAELEINMHQAMPADIFILHFQEKLGQIRYQYTSDFDLIKIVMRIKAGILKMIDPAQSVNDMQSFVIVMLAHLDLLGHDNVRDVIDNLIMQMQRRLDPDQFKSVFAQIIRSLIEGEVYDDSVHYALETVFEESQFVNIIAGGKFLDLDPDEMLKAWINQQSLARQAPRSRYELFSRLIFQTLSADPERATRLLAGIDFIQQNSSSLPNALFRQFIPKFEGVKGTRSGGAAAAAAAAGSAPAVADHSEAFLGAIADSMQINAFQSAEVVAGREHELIGQLNHMVGLSASDRYVDRIIDQERDVFTGYRLAFVADLPAENKLENHVLYISKHGSMLAYIAIDNLGEIKRSTLTCSQYKIELVSKKPKYADLKPETLYIYKSSSRRPGHTVKCIVKNYETGREANFELTVAQLGRDNQATLLEAISTGQALAPVCVDAIYNIVSQFGYRRESMISKVCFSAIQTAISTQAPLSRDNFLEFSQLMEARGLKLFGAQRPPVHLFLSLIFLWGSKSIKIAYRDRLSWLQFLFHFGVNSPAHEQLDLVRSVKDDLAHHRKVTLFADFSESLNELYSYYHEHHLHRDQYQRIYALIIDRLITAARLIHGVSLVQLVAKLQEMIGHFIAAEKDWLDLIFASDDKQSLGEYASGVDAVLGVLKDITSNVRPMEWGTASTSDRIFFLYSYVKYPVFEYQKWVLEANVKNNAIKKGYMGDRYIRELFANFAKRRDTLPGVDVLPDLGFKFLQHSQTTAILTAINPPNNSNHVFARVGTGQGKSLIIAMTALHYALQGRRVHVFTVYEHLARRDYLRFKKLYDRFDIPSLLIDSADFENSKTTPNNDALIVYSEMADFFRAVDQTVRRRSSRDLVDDETTVFDFFDQDVVILDEADSIFCERSEFANTVYDVGAEIGIKGMTRASLANSDATRRQLGGIKSINRLFVRLREHGLMDLFDRWYTHNQGSWAAGSSRNNSFGIPTHYIGGAFHELTQGKCYSHPICLDPLAHLARYNRVIGFSGSIDVPTLERLDRFFGAEDTVYMEVPPFFGLSRDRNYNVENRDITNPSAWISALKADIESALDSGQPVLVFADYNEDAEWDAVKKLVHAIAVAKGREVNEVTTDDDLDSKLSKASQPHFITLASDIIGRGADILIQPSVLRTSANKGLHVVISYYPYKLQAGQKMRDERKLVQMIGRTARMDSPGTHSLITSNQSVLVKDDTSPIQVDIDKRKYHDLMVSAFKQTSRFILGKDQKSIQRWSKFWSKWFVFCMFVDAAEKYPDRFEDPKIKDIGKWIVNELLRARFSKVELKPFQAPLALTSSSRLFSSAVSDNNHGDDSAAAAAAAAAAGSQFG